MGYRRSKEESFIMNNSQLTILVLDDEPDLLELLSALLSVAGYQVQAVQTAGELQHYLGEGGLPSLFVLDLLLAGSHGGELVCHLKDDERTRGIPILMISAYPNAEREARAGGADAFLAKPFDIDEFLALVASLLARHQEEQLLDLHMERTQSDLLTSAE
jgi:CheY-like chemotaxis protein